MTTEPSGTSELGGVIAQGRLVEYQPGSVVSRRLIKKPAGTVTAFAFDAGEGLSEHTAPYKEQWTRLLAMADEIREFMKEHDAELKAKPES